MSVFSYFKLPFRENKALNIIMLLVLVMPLVFTLQTYEHYEVVKLSVMLVLTGWCAITLLKQKPRGDHELGVAGLAAMPVFPILYSIIGFFWIWSIVSGVAGYDMLNSMFGFYPRFASGIIFYTAWSLLLISMCAVIRKEHVSYLAKTAIVSAWLVALVGILQSYGIGFYQGLTAEPFQRAPGLLGNPNFTTMFTSMVLPFAVVFIAKTQSLWSRVWYGTVICTILFSTIILSSRGALLAVYGSLIFLCLIIALWHRAERLIAVVAGMALVVTVVFSLLFYQLARPGAIASTLNLKDSNIELRVLTWLVSVRAIEHHPIFGSGPGNFHIAFERERDSLLASKSGIFDDAHNLFIHMAVTGGLPLALAFIVLLGYVLYKGYRVTRFNPTLEVSAAAAGIIAFIIAACFNPVVLSCFVILALCIAIILTHAEIPIMVDLLKPLKIAVRVLGGVLALYGIVLITSEFVFYHGYAAYRFGANPQIGYRYTNLAIHINPTNDLFYYYRTLSALTLHGSETKILGDIANLKSLHPTTTNAYMQASFMYFIYSRQYNHPEYFDTAVRHAMQTFKWDPYYAARYGRVGYLYFLGNKLVTAREFQKVALIYDNQYLPSWIMLARIYQLEQKPDQVKFVLSRAWQTHPDIEGLAGLAHASKDSKNVPLLTIPLIPQVEE